MANPVILSASGDVLVIKGSARGGVGPTILTFTGASWTGSAVVKINTAYPGEAVSLVTVAYTNRATGATVAAGTAITADAVIEVGQNNADIYLTYTHTSGTCNVVTLEAPMNSRVPNPLDVDVSIFDTSLTSASGKIGLGAAPGTAGAINVDGATYSGVPLSAPHGTATLQINTQNNSSGIIGMVTAHNLILMAQSGQSKFTIGGAAGVSTLTFNQTTASVLGGATSTTFYQSNGSTVALQYLAGSATGIGVAATANTGLGVNAAATAATGVGYGTHFSQPVTAAANSDVVEAMRVSPSFTPGAFTGLIARGVTINSFSVAGFTSPGQATMLNLGVLTGTGASVAVALQISPPTGASTNYLIAHTTPATFNVTAAGAITAAGNLSVAQVSGTGTFIVANSTATPAGGSTAVRLTMGTTSAFGVYIGSGAPSVVAAQGSLYLRSDGSSTSTRAYIATNSAGAWTAITTAT